MNWKYIPDALDANKGGLWLDGRLVIRLESGGPGHIIDSGEMIARALRVPPPGVETEGQIAALEKMLERASKIGSSRQLNDLIPEMRALLSTSSRGEDLSSRDKRASLPASDGIPSEWRPIESAPTEEGPSFLIRTHAFGGRETVVIQVSRFEGRLYPDALGAAIDWESAITHAKYWMPLPSAPVGSQASE